MIKKKKKKEKESNEDKGDYLIPSFEFLKNIPINFQMQILKNFLMTFNDPESSCILSVVIVTQNVNSFERHFHEYIKVCADKNVEER